MLLTYLLSYLLTVYGLINKPSVIAIHSEVIDSTKLIYL